MGKTKRRIRKKKMANPTGLPSIREAEAEPFCGTDDDVRKSVRRLTEKLQSGSDVERDCACSAIAALASCPLDGEDVTAIVDVVRVVAPLAVDPCVAVRHSAVVALRSMSGLDGACHVMVAEQDVMTPLVALFKQYSLGWEPSRNGEPDPEAEVLLEAVQLLWNLCESSDRAVRIFNKEQLLVTLVPYLQDVERYGWDIPIRVAFCLYTVSEDNAEVVANLLETRNSEVVTRVLGLPATHAGAILLRVLAAGIVLNVNCGRLTEGQGASSTVLRTLAGALGVDVAPLVASVAADQDEEETTSLQSLEWLVSAQEVALEVLTNVCCGDDDDDESLDDDGGSSSGSEENFDVDMEDDDVSDAIKLPVNLPVEVHEALVSHNFLEMVLSKAGLPEVPAIVELRKSSRGVALCKSLRSVQNHAFLCLNNLTSCLDVDELGGAEKLHELWVDVGKLVFREIEAKRFGNVESMTTAMSCILQKLTGRKWCHVLKRTSGSDLERLFELGRGADDPRVRVNVVRMVGSVGRALSAATDLERTAALCAMVGTFLLEVCFKDTEVWVEAEALDAIFDVFGDDHVDPVAAQLGLVDKLKQLQPLLRSKVGAGSNRKCFGDHAAIIATARTNLARFIRYKCSGNKMAK